MESGSCYFINADGVCRYTIIPKMGLWYRLSMWMWRRFKHTRLHYARWEMSGTPRSNKLRYVLTGRSGKYVVRYKNGPVV